MGSSDRSPRSRSPSNGGNGGKKSKKDKKDKKLAREKAKEEARKLLASPDTDSSEDPVTGGGAPSALAIPDNNTIVTADLINSLCRAVNSMTTTMTRVERGMDQMQAELRQQKTHIDAVVAQVEHIASSAETRMKHFEDEMKAKNDNIDARLAKLAASTGSPRPTPWTGPASSSAAASAGPAGSGGRAAAPSGPAPVGGHRPTRIWIKGFNETLTTKFLNDYAKQAIARLPAELQTGASTGAPGFGSAVFVDYPLSTRVAPIRAALKDLHLTHVDENGTEHHLRIHPDIPLEVRHRGRVLGELWKLLEPHLRDLAPPLRPDVIKLGNSNGKLFLVLGNRPVELFATNVDEQGTLHVTPHAVNLKKYQIGESLSKTWISSACRSASRGGQ
jgi:hypothetical protein